MKLRPFELALVIIFVVLGITALLLLMNFDGGKSAPEGSGAISGEVQIWGTLPGEGMPDMIKQYQESYDSYADVKYWYVQPERFHDTLINSLADGDGPDLVLVSQEELVDLRRRMFPEPYETFPLRDIKTLYVDGAEIFALQDGLYARPIAVDPLVLFWNRDILATNGFLESPRTWEELVNVQFDDLINRGFDRTINRAVIAMGEYENVRNAFGVVSMLLIQGGTAGVTEQDTKYLIELDKSVSGRSDPLRTAADFYTRFSRPANTLYSWNRSFGEDRQEFIGEDVAFYFGYASEGPEIERLNPNLNFDIAEVPQGATASVRRTYGRFYGLGVLRTSDNYSAAQSVLQEFTKTNVADTIAVNSGLVPATRATVNRGSNTTYGRIAYQSAAIAYGWLSPDQSETDDIFSTMMSDINENRRTLDEATRDALGRLELEY